MAAGYKLHTSSHQNNALKTTASQRAMGASGSAFFQGITFGNASSAGSGSTVSSGGLSQTDIEIFAAVLGVLGLVWLAKR